MPHSLRSSQSIPRLQLLCDVMSERFVNNNNTIFGSDSGLRCNASVAAIDINTICGYLNQYIINNNINIDFVL